MGRQPFLTRLALGRSPFEPSSSITQSSEYVQVDTSQQDPLTVTRGSSNRYIQLYDERGNPINPGAREHGRRLRQAQNDVLSSIGVVERRPSPLDLPGASRERLEQLENEDSVGSAIALVSTITESLCTWWIGSLRDRVLTFRYRDTVPFSRIVASEYQLSGPRIMYAGFPSRLLSTASVQALVYVAHVFRPIDQLLYVTHATRKTKHFFQQWKSVTWNCFGLFVEVLFYPLAYHANLQRLGLIPARPFLPQWKAFIPFTVTSPIRLLSLQHGLSLSALPEILTATATSPLLFVCLERFFGRWVYAIIYEAVETTIFHPSNPDLPPPDDTAKSNASAILGLRRKSPSIMRNLINKLLVILGWGEPLPLEDTHSRRQRSDESVDIEVQGRQITNISRLHISPVHPATEYSSDHTAEGHNDIVADVVAEVVTGVPAPSSPTASEASQNNDDPRIRITSREGMVQMEVRLPPRVLSSHTEVAEHETSHLRDTTSSAPVEQVLKPYHRVTQLSTNPAQTIGAICKAQLVGWATLPLKLVTFRLIARHYLHGHQGEAVRSVVMPPYGILTSVSNCRQPEWRSIGLLLSRLVLCGILEVAIDLSLWSLQWVAVTWFGRKYFGWGSL